MASVPIANIKLHANWNFNNSTFEDHYYKPGDQQASNATIMDMVLVNATKNITASDVELEATAIVISTTQIAI